MEDKGPTLELSITDGELITNVRVKLPIESGLTGSMDGNSFLEYYVKPAWVQAVRRLKWQKRTGFKSTNGS